MMKPSPRYSYIHYFPAFYWTWLLCHSQSPLFSSALSSSSPPPQHRFVILGGAGRIGTAVASQLLLQQPQSEVVLVGRRRKDGFEAVQQVLTERPGCQVEFSLVDDVWDTTTTGTVLRQLFKNADCVIHTAGPYHNQKPGPLQLALECQCKAYVDVSDPLPFLESSLRMNETAVQSGTTTALVSAGAFPGMSNVLAMEASSTLIKAKEQEDVQNCRFSYFTAGLGGSGTVNLYITNLGFGDSMAQYDQGRLRFFTALSGILLGKVDFFLPHNDAGFGNEQAKRRVGTRQVFSWPFPEAATVATELRIRGDSSACMGTAPDIWNTMLGILVKFVPQAWWRNTRFSKFMADFSEPLVIATNKMLQLTDEAQIGESHAMRVDVTRQDGTGVSIVQAHDSFRRCVGQSCAEFAMDLLAYPAPGVYLPEHRYRDNPARNRIIEKLTNTQGTFCYTGPVELDNVYPPTELDRALNEAELAESNTKQPSSE